MGRFVRAIMLNGPCLFPSSTTTGHRGTLAERDFVPLRSSECVRVWVRIASLLATVKNLGEVCMPAWYARSKRNSARGFLAVVLVKRAPGLSSM